MKALKDTFVIEVRNFKIRHGDGLSTKTKKVLAIDTEIFVPVNDFLATSF